jgi:hypothetical protein
LQSSGFSDVAKAAEQAREVASGMTAIHSMLKEEYIVKNDEAEKKSGVGDGGAYTDGRPVPYADSTLRDTTKNDPFMLNSSNSNSQGSSSRTKSYSSGTATTSTSSSSTSEKDLDSYAAKRRAKKAAKGGRSSKNHEDGAGLTGDLLDMVSTANATIVPVNFPSIHTFRSLVPVESNTHTHTRRDNSSPLSLCIIYISCHVSGQTAHEKLKCCRQQRRQHRLRRLCLPRLCLPLTA